MGSKGKGVRLLRHGFQVVRPGPRCRRVDERVLRDERPDGGLSGHLDVKESS